MAPDLKTFSVCLSPKASYEAVVAKGIGNVSKPWYRCFHQSFYGGLYVGYGGLLSIVVCGGMPTVAEENPGLLGLMFGLLFPVNLLLLLLTGGQLFTGNCAAMPAAYLEGEASLFQVFKFWGISWVANQSGCLLFAFATWYCGILDNDLTRTMAAYTVVKKCSMGWGQTFVRGILCNWLVCMAVWLSGQAQDMTGKMIGIYIPISAFVAMGFEHSVANMFMLPFGLMAGAPLSVWDILWRNLIPVSLGNAFAGAVIVAGGYSFAFGHLGGYKSTAELAAEKAALSDSTAAAPAATADVEANVAAAEAPDLKESGKVNSSSNLLDLFMRVKTPTDLSQDTELSVKGSETGPQLRKGRVKTDEA